MPRATLMLLLAGCSEYDLGGKPPPTVPATTPTTPILSTVPAETTPETTPVVPPDTVVLTCDDDWSQSMPWVRSPVWTSASAPVDADGDRYYDPGFDVPADWAVLAALPDQDPVPEDHDLYYRAEFWLDAVVGTTEISFVGNDGVWLYANGWYLGHWGGPWRGEGCINVDDGSCGVNFDAPPADLTPFLVPGRNIVAVLLTNGPTGYYLDLDASCVE